MTTLSAKALSVLRWAAEPGQSQTRVNLLIAGTTRFSEKAFFVKAEELTDRGYLEYGVSVRGAWLTDKGKRALRDHAGC